MTQHQYCIETRSIETTPVGKTINLHFFAETEEHSRQYIMCMGVQHMIVIHGRPMLETLAHSAGKLAQRIGSQKRHDCRTVSMELGAGSQLSAEPLLAYDDWLVTFTEEGSRRLVSNFRADAGTHTRSMLIRGPRELVIEAMKQIANLSGDSAQAKTHEVELDLDDVTYIINPLIFQPPTSWVADDICRALILDEGQRIENLMQLFRISMRWSPSAQLLGNVVARYLEECGYLLVFGVLNGSPNAVAQAKRIKNEIKNHGQTPHELARLYGINADALKLMSTLEKRQG